MNKDAPGFKFFVGHCQYNQLSMLRQLAARMRDKNIYYSTEEDFKKSTQIITESDFGS